MSRRWTPLLGPGMRSRLQLLRSNFRALVGFWATEPLPLAFVSAFWHLVSPHADARLAVVGQSGGALVAARLSVPAVPESVALVLVGEDAVQPGAVRSRDRCL